MGGAEPHPYSRVGKGICSTLPPQTINNQAKLSQPSFLHQFYPVMVDIKITR